MPKVPKVGKGVMDNTEFAKELEKTDKEVCCTDHSFVFGTTEYSRRDCNSQPNH